MSLNFPNSPSTNDTHVTGGSTWIFNGEMWVRQGTRGAQGLQGLQGNQGTQGLQGLSNQGVQGTQGLQGVAPRVTISENPPSNPQEGDFWWDEDDGNLAVYYNDGDSNQWISAINAGAQGVSGVQGSTGTPTASGSAPASANSAGTAGTIAYDSNYIYICIATNTWKRVAIGSW